MLVEGSQTEMRVYPSWFSVLLPQYKRVDNITDLQSYNYILKSGFGIPSIFNHIEHAAKDISQVDTIDYFIICLDLEGSDEDDAIQKVNACLKGYQMNTKSIILLQKQCIETWFLGNESIYPIQIPTHFEPYHEFYNVAKFDPEDMEKPMSFEGSIGNYHLRYLAQLFRANHMNYGKRSTKRVEKKEYLEALIQRVENTDHLTSFKEFLAICNLLKHS